MLETSSSIWCRILQPTSCLAPYNPPHPPKHTSSLSLSLSLSLFLTLIHSCRHNILIVSHKMVGSNKQTSLVEPNRWSSKHELRISYDTICNNLLPSRVDIVHFKPNQSLRILNVSTVERIYNTRNFFLWDITQSFYSFEGSQEGPLILELIAIGMVDYL